MSHVNMPGQAIHNYSRSRQLSLNANIVLLIAGLCTLASTLLPQLMSSWQFWDQFGAAQLAYALPTTIVLFSIAIMASQGTSYLLTPLVSIMVGFLLFFSAGPLINPVNEVWATSLYTSPEKYLVVVGFYSLGLCTFLLGTYWVPKPRDSASSQRWFGFDISQSRFWLCFLVMVSLLIMCFGTLIALNKLTTADLLFASRYGRNSVGFTHPLSRYFDQILRYLVITVSALSGAVFALSPQLYRRITALLAIGVCVIYILSSGVRSHFLYSIGGAVLVWWHLSQAANNGKRPRSAWRLWLIGGLAIVLAIQMISIRNTSGGLRSYLSANSNFVGVQRLIDFGVDRNIAFHQAVEIVPAKRPYVWGLSFISPFVAYVPRVLWEGKPTTAWGYMVGYTIFSNPNTSFSILGELHINFGLPGIAIGMMIVGMLTQRWRDMYLLYRSTVPMTIIYAMSIPAFAFFVRGDFQAAFNSIFYPILLVLLVLNLSRKWSNYSVRKIL